MPPLHAIQVVWGFLNSHSPSGSTSFGYCPTRDPHYAKTKSKRAKVAHYKRTTARAVKVSVCMENLALGPLPGPRPVGKTWPLARVEKPAGPARLVRGAGGNGMVENISRTLAQRYGGKYFAHACARPRAPGTAELSTGPHPEQQSCPRAPVPGSAELYPGHGVDCVRVWPLARTRPLARRVHTGKNMRNWLLCHSLLPLGWCPRPGHQPKGSVEQLSSSKYTVMEAHFLKSAPRKKIARAV
jgi:hypothetical protein